MRAAFIGGCVRGTGGERGSVAAGAAYLLSLAAAPTFAIMALLTGAFDVGAPLCSAAQRASPQSGMAMMYLLMTAFHMAPWLRLIPKPRDSAGAA